MRIVFTGGGTGGHTFPNIAVIRELKRVTRPRRGWPGNSQPPPGRDKLATVGGIEVFYIGAGNSLEEKIARDEKIPFYGIHTGKLRRYFDLKNVVDFFKIPLGIFEAWNILRRLKPDLVFAKGGYVSVPVAFAARLRGAALWLHESDVSPGLGTKICTRFAQKLFLSFEASRIYFPRMNVAVVGNPVRESLKHGHAARGYAYTGFSKTSPIVLVMGGSLGAASINALVYKILPELLPHTQVLHVTGQGHHRLGGTSGARGTGHRELRGRYFAVPFLKSELADCYAIADLIVSRAGSGSIFEAIALHKPLLLIPLPKSASRGDQIENADACERMGFAEVLDQDTLTPSELRDAIVSILGDARLRASMIDRQKASHLGEGASKIASSIVKFQQEMRK